MGTRIKEIKRNVMHVLSGTVLTENFFVKNTHFIFVVFIIMVLYISNRYSCISKMDKIESLRRELKDVKYESLTISSELTGISRQSQVQTLIQKNGLNLIAPIDQTYKISKNLNEE